MFLTAFGDEIVKLAQQAPGVSWSPTPEQTAARARQSAQGVKRVAPEEPTKYKPVHDPLRIVPVRGQMMHGAAAPRPPNMGLPKNQAREAKLNPQFSTDPKDQGVFVKRLVPRVTDGKNTAHYPMDAKGNRISTDAAGAAHRASMAKRNEKLYRTLAFKGKLETKAEQIQKGVPSTKPDPKPSKPFVRSPMVDRVMGRPSPPRFKQKLESQAEKVPGAR